MIEGARGEDIAALRRMVIQRSRLLEISVTLNSTLELGKVLQFIIDSAADLLECEAASILLVDDKTKDLYLAASTGSNPGELRKAPVPLEGSIAGTIFREERPLILNELASAPGHLQRVDKTTMLKTRSLIGVPMRIRDKVTGVLEAVNKRNGTFDESDLQTLEIIASQAAVAINNARLHDAIQRTYDELGKLDRLKSDFIAIASHELRTPLGVILGYASLLQEEANPEASEHATVVLNTAIRMRRLIEDMTNMNLLQVGSAELELEHQPLPSIAQTAYKEVAEVIHAKSQTLTLTLPEETLTANCDGPKMAMALTNLLNNAMRFTPAEGHIELRLERHGSEAWFKVIDDGIGIPPEQLERVFDRFYQVGDHMTRRQEGLGLGLAIVKAIAEAHDGRVWAESDGPGHGTEFTIALPLA